MSRTKCLECGANHSWAVYNDGSYCHACGHKERDKHIYTGEELTKTPLALPEVQEEFPIKAVEWLQKYNITKQHMMEHQIFFSPKYQRVCFPRYLIYDSRDKYMVACWMRSINDNVKPKWVFVGDKREPYYYSYYRRNERARDLVICEDVISAIRISDYKDVLALCGTNFSSVEFTNIFNQYKRIICFLDGDKAGQTATESLRKKRKLLNEIKIIKALKDPKCFRPRELEAILNAFNE